ncbi:unnamed protein product [Closterium sp. NIES-65]|nr:unnamed protein product [Closterium sp. NIES-65]
MWKGFQGLQAVVKEGLQELGRDALRETGMIKEAVAPRLAGSGILGLVGVQSGDEREGEGREEEEEEDGWGLEDDEEEVKVDERVASGESEGPIPLSSHPSASALEPSPDIEPRGESSDHPGLAVAPNTSLSSPSPREDDLPVTASSHSEDSGSGGAVPAALPESSGLMSFLEPAHETDAQMLQPRAAEERPDTPVGERDDVAGEERRGGDAARGTESGTPASIEAGKQRSELPVEGRDAGEAAAGWERVAPADGQAESAGGEGLGGDEGSPEIGLARGDDGPGEAGGHAQVAAGGTADGESGDRPAASAAGVASEEVGKGGSEEEEEDRKSSGREVASLRRQLAQQREVSAVRETALVEELTWMKGELTRLQAAAREAEKGKEEAERRREEEERRRDEEAQKLSAESGAREKARRKAEGEVERLQVLCAQLQASLAEAAEGREADAKAREQMARRVERMEDELEAERVKARSLQAEMADVEAGADEEMGELEERVGALEARVAELEAEKKGMARAAEEERREWRRKVEAAEAMSSAAAAVHKKDLEAVERKRDAAQQQVQKLREEVAGANKALAEAREAVRVSEAERAELEEVAGEREASMEAARTQLTHLQAELEVARREAAEGGVKVAEAMAEVYAARKEARARGMQAEETHQLEVKLSAATAAAASAAAEAEELKGKVAAGEREVKEVQRGLAAVEAELALANQRVAEAEQQAEEAKRQRAQAEGTSEQLREETERRAKLFNAAVKAAVSRIQSELEEERDEALQQVQQQGEAMEQMRQDMRALEVRLVEVEGERAALEKRGEEAEGREVHQRVVVERLRREVEEGEGRVRAAMAEAEGERQAGKQLQGKLAETEARRAEAEAAVAARDKEVEALRQQVADMQRDSTSLKVAALEASNRAGEEERRLQRRISELEQQVASAAARASKAEEASEKEGTRRGSGDGAGSSGSSTAVASSAKARAAGGGGGVGGAGWSNPLEGLGLETVRWKDKLKAESEGDVEVGSSSADRLRKSRLAHSSQNLPATSAGTLASLVGSARRLFFEDDRLSAAPGRVSRRTFLLIAYVFLLHLMRERQTSTAAMADPPSHSGRPPRTPRTPTLRSIPTLRRGMSKRDWELEHDDKERRRRERKEQKLERKLHDLESEDDAERSEDEPGHHHRRMRPKVPMLKKFKQTMKKKKYQKLLEKLQEIQDERTEDELAKVGELRKILAEKNLLPPRFNEHHMLLRFLKARKFDMEKTTEMWAAMLKWRDEFGVDECLKFEFPELAEVKRVYPHGHHGVDREGRPIYIELIGRVDATKVQAHRGERGDEGAAVSRDGERVLGITTMERFLKYHVKEFERTFALKFPACSLAAKRHIDQTTSILDVAEMGMKNFSADARNFLAMVSKVDGDNYPETLNRLFVVNAGFAFRSLWSGIKGMLDPKTASKIQVLGTDYKKKLFEAIDPSQLPEFFGGTCTCEGVEGGCLMSDKGPWRDGDILRVVRLQRTGTISGGDNTEDVLRGGRIRWQSGQFKLDAEDIGDTGSEVSDLDDLGTPSFSGLTTPNFDLGQHDLHNLDLVRNTPPLPSCSSAHPSSIMSKRVVGLHVQHDPQRLNSLNSSRYFNDPTTTTPSSAASAARRSASMQRRAPASTHRAAGPSVSGSATSSDDEREVSRTGSVASDDRSGELSSTGMSAGAGKRLSVGVGEVTSGAGSASGRASGTPGSAVSALRAGGRGKQVSTPPSRNYGTSASASGGAALAGVPMMAPSSSSAPDSLAAATGLVSLLMSFFSAVANLPLLFSRIVITVTPPAHRLEGGGGAAGGAMTPPGAQAMLTPEQLLRRVQELESQVQRLLVQRGGAAGAEPERAVGQPGASQVEKLASGPSTPALAPRPEPPPSDWPQPAVERVTALESELATTKKMLKELLDSQEQLRVLIEQLQLRKQRRFGGCFVALATIVLVASHAAVAHAQWGWAQGAGETQLRAEYESQLFDGVVTVLVTTDEVKLLVPTPDELRKPNPTFDYAPYRERFPLPQGSARFTAINHVDVFYDPLGCLPLGDLAATPLAASTALQRIPPGLQHICHSCLFFFTFSFLTPRDADAVGAGCQRMSDKYSVCAPDSIPVAFGAAPAGIPEVQRASGFLFPDSELAEEDTSSKLREPSRSLAQIALPGVGALVTFNTTPQWDDALQVWQPKYYLATNASKVVGVGQAVTTTLINEAYVAYDTKRTTYDAYTHALVSPASANATYGALGVAGAFPKDLSFALASPRQGTFQVVASGFSQVTPKSAPLHAAVSLSLPLAIIAAALALLL